MTRPYKFPGARKHPRKGRRGGPGTHLIALRRRQERARLRNEISRAARKGKRHVLRVLSTWRRRKGGKKTKGKPHPKRGATS